MRDIRRPVRVVCVLLTMLRVCYGIDQASSDTLHYFLNLKEERGNIFYQAKLDNVDYRVLLKGAIAKDEKSLNALFRYTAEGNLMGEGAETHGAILQALLYVYGDKTYAKVLSRLSHSIRNQAIAYLDERFGLECYWKQFPRTYALASHERSS